MCYYSNSRVIILKTKECALECILFEYQGWFSSVFDHEITLTK